MSKKTMAKIPEQDIDFLLFKRRRYRPAKSCYPCKRRKVKCNLGEPCGSCETRGHPDLCDYGMEAPRETDQAETVENTDSQANSLRLLTEASRTSDLAQGVYVDPAFPYRSQVHLGSESLPNLLFIYQNLNSRQTPMEMQHPYLNPSPSPQAIFELLCLQDSSTNFPFVNLWTPEDGPEKVYSALPENDALQDHFRFFKTSLYRILPAIIHLPQFETTLSHFLSARVEAGMGVLLNPPLNCTPSWFALLFSILACGVQLSSSEVESEILKARVFASCSFQCLRLSNFISFPNIEVVQTLIMLVNFLRNQADAGASWSILVTLLGLNIRLAQSLGMHCSPDPSTISDPAIIDEARVKFYIWRSLIWQDTLVSLCYDRPSGITILEEVPLTSLSAPSGSRPFSFSDSCHHLFVIANKIGQALNHAKFSKELLSLHRVREFRGIINRVEVRSLPHMQDVTKCQNRDDCIEHYAFRMFLDSVMLCLSRPAVLSNESEYNKELTELYLTRCYSALRTYLELLRLNCPIRRSWIFVHVTLSCALTLGLAANTTSIAFDGVFLRNFVDKLSQSTICANVPAYENALKLLRELLR